MSNKDTDTDSLKYILEELDPAEIIEFERKMAENPDLHIEVESIRRMKSKLSHLPDLSPPRELTESILTMAANKSEGSNHIKGRFFLSAAVLILGLTTGSLLIQNPFDNSSGINSQASANFSSVVGQSNTEQTTSELKPWVDRQNILHLQGFENSSNASVVFELNNSFDKLKPVGRLPSQQTFNRSLQLTGSNR